MDELSPEKVISKINSPYFLSQLIKTNAKCQVKHSKLVYSKKQARDITLYMKQINEMERKTKHFNHQKKSNSVDQNKYDENELKELNFAISPPKINQNLPTQQQTKTKFHHSKQPYKKFSLRQPKRIDSIALPFISQMYLSQTRKRSSTILSPKKLKLKLKKIGDSQDKLEKILPEKKIVIKEQKMINFINNIADFFKGYDRLEDDYFIDNSKINKKLMQRYNLKPKVLIQNKRQISIDHIKFPFCQFVGEKDARKSVTRIFNMSIELAQRLAFKVYDRNANGIIDEKDIIQIMHLSQQNEAVKEDFEILIKHYKVLDSKNKIDDSCRGKIDNLSQVSQISLPTQKSSRSPQLKNAKFQKQKFFVFLQTQNEAFKKKEKVKVSLSWKDFQNAFYGKRPKIFYDMLNYLFGIAAQDIFHQAPQNPQNVFQRFKIFSSFGKALSRKNKKAKTQEIEVMSQKKINVLMKRLRSVQRLQDCKF